MNSTSHETNKPLQYGDLFKHHVRHLQGEIFPLLKKRIHKQFSRCKSHIYFGDYNTVVAKMTKLVFCKIYSHQVIFSKKRCGDCFFVKKLSNLRCYSVQEHFVRILVILDILILQVSVDFAGYCSKLFYFTPTNADICY